MTYDLWRKLLLHAPVIALYTHGSNWCNDTSGWLAIKTAASVTDGDKIQIGTLRFQFKTSGDADAGWTKIDVSAGATALAALQALRNYINTNHSDVLLAGYPDEAHNYILLSGDSFQVLCLQAVDTSASMDITVTVPTGSEATRSNYEIEHIVRRNIVFEMLNRDVFSWADQVPEFVEYFS